MQLTELQSEILNNPSRMKVLIAGRRFGKTFIAINSLAKFARYPNKKVMYVAPTYRMAKQIAWDELKEQMRMAKQIAWDELKEQMRIRGWARKINESELKITLVNGSVVMLRSADNPDSIRGIGLDYVVIDEAADISESAWKAVIRPTLSDREGHALIIGTPKGRNWLYEVYNDAKHQTDWHSWQKTTIDGGQVSAEEIEKARIDLGEREFKQEYLATFVSYSGIIYYSFGEHNIKQIPVTTTGRMPLLCGIDFNYSPITSVIGVKTNYGIHIIDEIEIYGSDTNELTQEIYRRYPDCRYVAYPDASGAQHRTSAIGGVTDHIILRNNGFQVLCGSVNPSVKDRIASVNSVLKADNCRLTIDPKCVKLINALRKQVYKDGTRAPEKDTGYDHLNDALGYMINYCYPVKQNINTPQKISRRV